MQRLSYPTETVLSSKKSPVIQRQSQKTIRTATSWSANPRTKDTGKRHTPHVWGYVSLRQSSRHRDHFSMTPISVSTELYPKTCQKNILAICLIWKKKLHMILCTKLSHNLLDEPSLSNHAPCVMSRMSP